MTNKNILKRLGIIGAASMALVLHGCQGAAGMALNQIHPLESDDAGGITDVLNAKADLLEGFQVANDTIHLNIEETAKVEVKFHHPETALYYFDFSSSDENICRVMRDGTILGIEPGKAIVTIEDRLSGLKKEITVWVDEAVYPKEILLSSKEITLMEGEYTTLQATVIPENAEDCRIIWSSSDEAIATVNDKGEIRAVAKGACIITASAQADETVKAKLQVQVLKPDNNGTPSSNQNSNANAGMNGASNAGTGGSNGSSNNGSNSGNGNSGTENSGGGDSDATVNAYYMDSYAEQVLGIVNARREEAGLAPLTMNYTLVSAAKVRAVETVQSFSHTRPNGTSCFTAFDEAGVGYSGAGENIAAGQRSPESAMNSWMNSEGHRANILNGSFTQIGIACYYDPDSPYGYYWVQCFIY